MSARPSTSAPDSASGATYCNVPTKNPVRVSRSSGGSSASRAIPKSSRLTQKPLDRDGVAPEARAQYFERTGAALGMLRAVDFRRPALAHALEQAVAGDRPAHVSLAGHGTRETNVRIRG